MQRFLADEVNSHNAPFTRDINSQHNIGVSQLDLLPVTRLLHDAVNYGLTAYPLNVWRLILVTTAPC